MWSWPHTELLVSELTSSNKLCKRQGSYEGCDEGGLLSYSPSARSNLIDSGNRLYWLTINYAGESGEVYLLSGLEFRVACSSFFGKGDGSIRLAELFQTTIASLTYTVLCKSFGPLIFLYKVCLFSVYMSESLCFISKFGQMFGLFTKRGILDETENRPTAFREGYVVTINWVKLNNFCVSKKKKDDLLFNPLTTSCFKILLSDSGNSAKEHLYWRGKALQKL